MIGISISVIVLNQSVLTREYQIIYSNCILGSLIDKIACWIVCAWNKLQQWCKRVWNNRLSILKALLRCSRRRRKQQTIEWQIEVYCLPLACELPSSVRLTGITFNHHSLDIFRLANCNPSIRGKWLLKLFPKLNSMSLNRNKKHYWKVQKEVEIPILGNKMVAYSALNSMCVSDVYSEESGRFVFLILTPDRYLLDIS